VHEKRIEVRWRDVDNYGHVNNAVYLTYLEEVRDEWLARTLRAEDVAHIEPGSLLRLYSPDPWFDPGSRMPGLGDVVRFTLDGATASDAESLLHGSGARCVAVDPADVVPHLAAALFRAHKIVGETSQPDLFPRAESESEA